ncbi:MAG: cytochrome c [Gemmatimonadota bacterium]
MTAFATPDPDVPNERSVWSGVYSQNQAARGRETFGASCAACHSADLSGRGPIPALRGDSFTGNRHGGTVGDLYERISTTMPPSRPGQLSAEDYADVVAYLLQENAFPHGSADLPAQQESLHLIVFDEQVAD